ncbi:dihydrodipicolinate synthase family protein [Bauldia litoralis]|uniref:dihydrodipicolinate synthase family protein n=1 Tax=Bauldia litoralis TaxID=665467 RepID=UPI003267EB4F
MKTDPVTPADLVRSVIAVPPLARAADGSADFEQNRKIVGWMAEGGVSSFLYGGNANFYHLGLAEFPAVLDMMVEIAPADGWMIPAFGPDFGKALDQVRILRDYDFPTAMALPMSGPTKPAGVATGLRRIADAYGRPITAYVRAENYFAPRDMAALIADGVVCVVKYAVERADPGTDRYLSELVEAIGTERLVSGIGERPAIVHVLDFGVAAFTSGSVTIAPHMSTAILKALKSGDRQTAEALRERFLAFEDQRDAHSPIVVLHDAVQLARIAETGPIQPYLANLNPGQVAGVADAAKALYEENRRYLSDPAT